MDMKFIIRKNRVLAWLAYYIREKRNELLSKKYAYLPINSKKVLFFRPGGGYGDNPKAISEYLHKKFPEIKLVWACESDYYFSSIPSYVHAVIFESKEYYKELATAGAWVCSSILPAGTKKRQGQIYIQTWHGDKGFKKFGYDAAELKSIRNGKNRRRIIENEICDYFLTGANWFLPKIRSAIGYNGNIIAHGLPRNDCLIKKDLTKVIEIKNKIGILLDKKILLYSPTFRDHKGTHEIITSDIDLLVILNELEKKTGDEWVCLLRAHGGRKLHTDLPKTEKRFIDVTSYPDIADFLMISDMMITDYSSCAGDFALTNNFILLYQDDIESYTTKDRTLYFDMQDTPYFIAHSLDEALNIINSIDHKDIVENCEAIRNFYGVCESGHACEEVVDLILKNKERLEKM